MLTEQDKPSEKNLKRRRSFREKQRRIRMRKSAAINAFHENAEEFGIHTFMREETKTAQEMAEKIARHLGLGKRII